MRPGEKNGNQYWFVSKQEFENDIKSGDFLEYEINHKVAYYGTKKSDVESGLQAWDIMIKEIDTKWLKQLHENHADFKEHYTSIFLNVPDEEIRKRFYERNPDWKPEDIENRIQSTIFERKQAKKYCDYIIDATQSPEEVLKQSLKIIK